MLDSFLSRGLSVDQATSELLIVMYVSAARLKSWLSLLLTQNQWRWSDVLRDSGHRQIDRG
jgi:hypothetical protein